MKSVKLMLLSTIALVILAGLIAFRAKNKFSSVYCVATTFDSPGGSVCTMDMPNSKFYDGTGVPVTFFYTTKTQGLRCESAPCTVSTSFISD